MKNYRFTIFTPCYNGGKTIGRVFDSVCSQTYKNWEWIIINDGSTDNSANLINELLTRCPQDIKSKIVLVNQQNKGKHRSWNRAVSMATGDIFIPADCDDSFIEETLSFFNEKANSLCGDDFCNSPFSGINVCVYSPATGVFIGDKYPYDGLISDNLELQYKYNVKGEHWGGVRIDLLKKYLFPEIRGHFYTENYLWHTLAKNGYKTACYNKALRAYYYETESLTNNKSYKYNINVISMRIDFLKWQIKNVGRIIFNYNKNAYFMLYLHLVRQYIKRIISKII